MDAATLLPELLGRCPNLKLLVTSRERLNLTEEFVLWLEGLPFEAESASPGRPHPVLGAGGAPPAEVRALVYGGRHPHLPRGRGLTVRHGTRGGPRQHAVPASKSPRTSSETCSRSAAVRATCPNV